MISKIWEVETSTGKVAIMVEVVIVDNHQDLVSTTILSLAQKNLHNTQTPIIESHSTQTTCKLPQTWDQLPNLPIIKTTVVTKEMETQIIGEVPYIRVVLLRIINLLQVRVREVIPTIR